MLDVKRFLGRLLRCYLLPCLRPTVSVLRQGSKIGVDRAVPLHCAMLPAHARWLTEHRGSKDCHSNERVEARYHQR
jgi:hypothetical protein